jgi:glycosyltransferase involved in cell wall biosynthesis
VASDVGGLPTLVDDAVNGYLISERDPGVWADAVERSLDAVNAAALAEGAVKRARPYTWRAAAQSLLALVDTLVE